MKYVLRNTFHDTEVVVRLTRQQDEAYRESVRTRWAIGPWGNIMDVLSPSTQRRIQRELCGSEGCCCGPIRGGGPWGLPGVEPAEKGGAR